MNTLVHNTAPTSSLRLLGHPVPRSDEVLTPAVLRLLATLHRKFNARRLALLAAREQRKQALDAGEFPDFLSSTSATRRSNWHIAPVPQDLQDRRVEITGPVDRKTIINALNAPVEAFMADFEDASSPTWQNMINGQINLRDAVNRSIFHEDHARHKKYRLNSSIATLMVRPRGWHLHEKHVQIDGEYVSAAIFDFVVYICGNYEALAHRNTGPYFYLPKLESHLEARLWNDVFIATQDELGIRRGTIKVTVLIETVLAAFEMDEILFELREHAAGLNCGRWDYIFSFIKKFRNHPQYLLPDRSMVTMDQPFLKSYAELLIKTCHRRGAHAMGGMAAQIPIRDNPDANEVAMNKVRADKQREANAGHDGTWIAHPGLASITHEIFDASRAPNQLRMLRDVNITASDLLRVPEGVITDGGLRHNLRVGVQYLQAWLDGSGCVPLYNLMEDAATAEISRAQVWQWVRHGARTADGEVITAHLVDTALAEELDVLRQRLGNERFEMSSYAAAARLFAHMTTKDELDDFLTSVAYELLP